MERAFCRAGLADGRGGSSGRAGCIPVVEDLCPGKADNYPERASLERRWRRSRGGGAVMGRLFSRPCFSQCPDRPTPVQCLRHGSRREWSGSWFHLPIGSMMSETVGRNGYNWFENNGMWRSVPVTNRNGRSLPSRFAGCTCQGPMATPLSTRSPRTSTRALPVDREKLD